MDENHEQGDWGQLKEVIMEASEQNECITTQTKQDCMVR
jgi:hypothetical protein